MSELRVPLVVNEPLAEGDPNLRVPLVVNEPLAEGDPNLRVPLVVNEPLSEGLPSVRVPLVITEPLADGRPNLRISLLIVESLQPVPEEGVMATDLFPALQGLTWDVHKKPVLNTQVRAASNLKTVRNPMAPYPSWEFTLSFDYLPNDPANPNPALSTTDLEYLMGFFLQQGGRAYSWLFSDPSDKTVTHGAMLRLTDGLPGGDDVTTEFWLARTLGPFIEPIGQLNTGVAYTVYVDGAPQTEGPGADYILVAPNKVTFTTAPTTGQTVTASFTFWFVCSFLEDALDFQNFVEKLWELQELSFRSEPQ